MVRLIVPGFKYLGPGNKSPPEELFVADFVAVKHDRVYDAAHHRFTILCADLYAVILLIWVCFWSGVSCICLFTKFAFECCTGITFYPLRFFKKMEFILLMLVICALLWLGIIEMRLSGWRNARAINTCVLESTWESLECLLNQNRS